MRLLWEMVSKILLMAYQTLATALPDLADIYKVREAQLPLGEAMLSTPELFVLHVPENEFKDTLLHHLPRDQGEADWPVVPRLLLLEVMGNRQGQTLYLY